MKQLRFNVRDAYRRVTGQAMPTGTSSGATYRDGFYDGYMARCKDQQRLNDNKRAKRAKK